MKILETKLDSIPDLEGVTAEKYESTTAVAKRYTAPQKPAPSQPAPTVNPKICMECN